MCHNLGRRGNFKDSCDYIIRSLEQLKALIKHYNKELKKKSENSEPKYKLLLYLRYYAQILLQSCAIRSQLQDHNSAL